MSNANRVSTAQELIEEVLRTKRSYEDRPTKTEIKLARMLKLAIEQRDSYALACRKECSESNVQVYDIGKDNAELDRIAEGGTSETSIAGGGEVAFSTSARIEQFKNAEFIAHAREDIPRLVAALELALYYIEGDATERSVRDKVERILKGE